MKERTEFEWICMYGTCCRGRVGIHTTVVDGTWGLFCEHDVQIGPFPWGGGLLCQECADATGKMPDRYTTDDGRMMVGVHTLGF
jgi:hypothetical protein